MPKSARSRPLTVLITAGPTVEDIDPVRFISNRSSGKLGVEVAAAAVARGFNTLLVHGPVGDRVLARIQKLRSAKVVAVRSASGMAHTVLQLARKADIVIKSAAVADFTPEYSVNKIKKSKGGLVLRLRPTTDILRELGRRKGFGLVPILIGFALETGHGKTAAERRKSSVAEATRKLWDKNLDAVVLDSPHTMGSDRGDFRIILRDGRIYDCSGMTKRDFARRLLKLARQLLATATRRDAGGRAPKPKPKRA